MNTPVSPCRDADTAVLEHWGLTRFPFDGGQPFVPLPGHVEAAERIAYLVRRTARIGWVNGPEGVGKSFVLGHAADELRRSGQSVVWIDGSGQSTDEVLMAIADSLTGLPVSRQRFTGVGVLREVLRSRALTSRPVTIFCDHAEDVEAVDLVARLTSEGGRQSSPVTMIAAGREGVAESAGLRAGLRIDVPALDTAETGIYVESAFASAGAANAVLGDGASEALCETTGGLPRSINEAVELLLLAGALDGTTTIEASRVRHIRAEMAGSSSFPDDDSLRPTSPIPLPGRTRAYV